MMKNVAIMFATLAVLSACEEAPVPEIVRTVDWYKENKADREAQIAKCNSNPGELAATPNCINASAAQSQVSLGSKNFGVDAEPPTFEK